MPNQRRRTNASALGHLRQAGWSLIHGLDAKQPKPHPTLVQSTIGSNSARDFWSPAFRLVVFSLAATLIGSLLNEFFGWLKVRSFTFGIVMGLATLKLRRLLIFQRSTKTWQLNLNPSTTTSRP